MTKEQQEAMKGQKACDILNALADCQDKEQTIVDIARQITDGKERVELVIKKEPLQPAKPLEPTRAESKARSNIFNDADGFCAYLEKYKTQNTVVWVDMSCFKAIAVIDELTTQGREYVAFEPLIHPLFKPWSDLDDYVPVKSFVDILHDNKRQIIDPAPLLLISIFSHVKASVHTEYRRERGNNSVNGFTCTFSVNGKQEEELVNMPEMIKVETPLFVGGKTQQFELDLLIDLCNSEVCVRVGVGDLTVKKVEAFEEMMAQVSKVENVTYCYGRPHQAEWVYLKSREF